VRLINYGTIKVYGGVDVQIHVFLTSVVALPPPPEGRAPGSLWIGGWVGGPQIRSGRHGEEKNLAPTGTRKFRSLGRSAYSQTHR
jgi:hypothetical protein